MATIPEAGVMQLPPIPTKRGGSAVSIVGGKIYVLGGGVSAREHLGTCECFDIGTEQWSSLPPMPTPRSNVVSVVVGKKIYVMGGLAQPNDIDADSIPSSAVECFDTESRAWKKVANLPEGRVKPALGAIGSTVYAISGRRDDDNADTVYAYDTVADSWSLCCKSPVNVRHSSASVIGGKLYMSGGTTYKRNAEGKLKGQGLRSVFEFDPATKTFTPLPDMNNSRTAHGMAAVGDTLYVVGGRGDGKLPVLEIDRLKLGTSRWETVEVCDTPRMIFEACASGSALYLLGGWVKTYQVPNEGFQVLALPAE
jgi:N-acetylneuraminic acid mutarotase